MRLARFTLVPEDGARWLCCGGEGHYPPFPWRDCCAAKAGFKKDDIGAPHREVRRCEGDDCGRLALCAAFVEDGDGEG